MDATPLFDHATHPDLAHLLDHCRKLAGENELPRAEDFRPSDTRWAIGWISLVDVLDGGADFRIRLFGSVCQSVFGADLTGLRLSQIESAGSFVGMTSDYVKVVHDRRPAYHSGKVIWPNGTELCFDRLLVPFAGRNGDVCRIVAAADCGMPAEDVVIMRGFGPPTVIADGPGPQSGFAVTL